MAEPNIPEAPKLFTKEEREKIKERANAILLKDPSVSKGEAAQRAISELFSSGQIVTAYKKISPGIPAAEVQKSFNLPQETRTEEVQDVDIKLRSEEASYISERSRQLEREGFSALEAETRARQELEQSIRKPVPLGYGGIEERGEAIAPLSAIGIPLSVDVPSRTSEIKGQAAKPPSGIDYKKLQDTFQKDLKLSPEEAADEVEVFKTYVLGPKLDRLSEKGIVGPEADAQALEESFKFLDEVQTKLTDKSTYLKGDTTYGPDDPLYKAFSRQIELGEGVPDLSEAMRDYLAASEEARKKREVQKRLDKKPTKEILRTPSGDVPYDKTQPIRALPAGSSIVTVPKTEKELRAEVDEESPTPWWLSDKAERIKEDPAAFEERGFFETTTPYGTKKESLGGFILRGALTIPNALAGAVTEITSVGDYEKLREKARAGKGYDAGITGSILQNIAENRGFFGEASEAAKLLNMDEYSAFALRTAGFAADILDPSMDILKGATTAVKAGAPFIGQNYRAYKALNKKAAGTALADAVKQGANDFLDNYLLTSFTSKRFDSGDFRNLMTRQVAEDLTTASELSLRSSEGARAAYEALSSAQKTSDFGKAFQKAIQEGDDVGSVLARMPQDSLAQRARAITDDLSKIASDPTSRFSASTRIDIARSLGAAAKVDDDVLRIVKEIFEKPTVGADAAKLNRAVAAVMSDESASKALRTAIMSDIASSEVARATKDISGLGYENVVALTKSTFVDKASAKTILDKVSGSEVGKIADKLKDTKIELISAVRGKGGPLAGASRGTEARVLPAYKLDDATAGEVNKVVYELETFGKLDAVSASLIRRRLRSRSLLVEDFRKIIDANIDLVAEGLKATGKKGTLIRGKDISELPVAEQVEFLMPMEQRSFTRTTARKIYEGLTGRTPATGALSVGQRQLLGEARQRMGALDTKLRKEISNFNKDTALKELYGLDPKKNYSIPEIVSVLIVGPAGPKRAENLQDAVQGILDDLFYTKSTTENVFDLFTGSSVSKKGGVFTASGQEELSELIKEAAARSVESPETLWQNIIDVVKKADEIVKSGDPSLLRRPDDIVNVFEKSKGKIPAEVQLGSYYRSEARRISEELVSDFINSEVGRGKISVFDELEPEIRRRTERTIQASLGTRLTGSELAIKLPDINSNIIQNRAVRILDDEKGLVDSEDIAKILEISDEAAKVLLKDKDFMRDFTLLVDLGDDIATGIIRRSGLKGADDPIGKIEKVLRDLTDPAKDDFQRLNILLGEDVANQIRGDLTSGFSRLRDEILDLLDSKYNLTGTELVGKLISGFVEGLNNFLYLLLLNSRTRFHGANLLTGADIFYATTGRLPRASDVVEGAKVLANRSPNSVIFTDRAGRSFTSGELNDILKTSVGQTVYRAGLPSADQERLLKLLEKGEGFAGNAYEVFKGLPQSEDLLFRYAALKSALREGRSIEEATALARKSMFDAGDITDAEKSFKKLALFYGFMRNNIVNAAKNLTRIKGLKRIGSVERFRKNLTDTLMGDEGETREYAPSFAQTRVIFDKMGFDPEKGKDLIKAGPPLASLDAIYSLADIIKGDASGIFGGALKSEYKSLLGVEDKYKIDPDEVPAEHMAILSLSGDPLDAINMLLAGMGAEPTSYVPTSEKGKGREIEGKEGRFRIPLTTPKQKKAYTTFMTVMSGVGLASPITDYTRGLTDAQGTKLEDMPIKDRIAFLLAAETPMMSLTPEKQAYFDRVSRLKELQALTAALKKDEDERIKAEMSPEEKAEMEDIKAARDEKSDAKADIARQGAGTGSLRSKKEIEDDILRALRRRDLVRVAELEKELKAAEAREKAAKGLD